MYKREKGGNLDSLRKGGQTGIFLVVIAIGWWIDAHEGREVSESVAEILEDALWVLSELSNVNNTEQCDDATPGRRPKRGAKGMADRDTPASKR
jgi:hypothetical protein